MHPHDLIQALALVLCVGAVATAVFQRLRMPVVLGYIVAGLIVGPHVPIPLVADLGIVQTLSELGVILLMFSLGLEFSLRKLAQVGPTAGVTALIQASLMLWLGYVVGLGFGWTPLESIFTGAIIAISSTTIIAKAFDEQNVRGKLREVVVGILIVEDLIAILLMAALTAFSMGSGLSPAELALTVGRLGAFLVGLVSVGMLVVPRAVRAVSRLHRPETTIVASVGICFAVALLAYRAGYSVALGAFLAGSLVSESGEQKTIEHLIQPVRDLFAAIFFVSVGMLIDPMLVMQNWAAVSVLTLVVVVGKVVGVALGAFATGNGTRTSVQAGMSLAQIGEFSFIIAGLGLSLNATGHFLYPVAVTVSALTTITTPWLIRASGPVASYVDRKLPRRLQTFVSLYGSWVENVKHAPDTQAPGANIRRLMRLLFLDAALVAVLVICVSLAMRRLTRFIEHVSGLGSAPARIAVITAAAAISVPLFIGIFRIARRLGITLAEQALPSTLGGKADLAAAPRRVFVVTLQVISVLIVGVPLVALTQPFIPGFQGAAILLLLLVVLALAFWRSATHLEGHVRAGAQAIIEALAAQARSTDTPPSEEQLADIHAVLPGLGEPVPIRLQAASFAVGQTLAQLNLRGLTGATVLAIRRGEESLLVPSAHETLQAGDILALAGTREAIDAAKQVLTAHSAGASAGYTAS